MIANFEVAITDGWFWVFYSLLAFWLGFFLGWTLSPGPGSGRRTKDMDG